MGKPIFETMEVASCWSKTTLNYRMMMENYPNLKEEVRGSNPGCEISYVLDRIWRWHVSLLSQKKIGK